MPWAMLHLTRWHLAKPNEACINANHNIPMINAYSNIIILLDYYRDINSRLYFSSPIISESALLGKWDLKHENDNKLVK